MSQNIEKLTQYSDRFARGYNTVLRTLVLGSLTTSPYAALRIPIDAHLKHDPSKSQTWQMPDGFIEPAVKWIVRKPVEKKRPTGHESSERIRLATAEIDPSYNIREQANRDSTSFGQAGEMEVWLVLDQEGQPIMEGNWYRVMFQKPNQAERGDGYINRGAVEDPSTISPLPEAPRVEKIEYTGLEVTASSANQPHGEDLRDMEFVTMGEEIEALPSVDDTPEIPVGTSQLEAPQMKRPVDAITVASGGELPTNNLASFDQMTQDYTTQMTEFPSRSPRVENGIFTWQEFDRESAFQFQVTSTGEINAIDENGEVKFVWTEISGWTVQCVNNNGVRILLDYEFLLPEERVPEQDHNVLAIREVSSLEDIRNNPDFRSLNSRDIQEWLRPYRAEGNSVLFEDTITGSQAVRNAAIVTAAMILHSTNTPTDDQLLDLHARLESGEHVMVSTREGDWDVSQPITIIYGNNPEGGVGTYSSNGDRSIPMNYFSVDSNGAGRIYVTNRYLDNWAVVSGINTTLGLIAMWAGVQGGLRQNATATYSYQMRELLPKFREGMMLPFIVSTGNAENGEHVDETMSE